MAEAYHAAERAARESYGRLLAWLAARGRDIAAAEDALADAFTAALATWPKTGTPAQPRCLAAHSRARRRLTDAARRRATAAARGPYLLRLAEIPPDEPRRNP